MTRSGRILRVELQQFIVLLLNTIDLVETMNNYVNLEPLGEPEVL